jgi:hypothetical protein
VPGLLCAALIAALALASCGSGSDHPVRTGKGVVGLDPSAGDLARARQAARMSLGRAAFVRDARVLPIGVPLAIGVAALVYSRAVEQRRDWRRPWRRRRPETGEALAMAAVALAQNPAPSIDVTAKVSPSKAGTKKSPKSERLDLVINNNKESKTSAGKIEIYSPKSLKLATKGLKTCSVATLNSQGKAACPTAAKAGTGTAEALVNPTSDTPATLKFNVTTFVAGKNKLAFYLEEQGNPNGVQQALPATIAAHKTKVYAQKITISIPANLQQPAPGVFSALVQIKSSIGLKSGKHALLSSIGCPKSREHQIGVKISYVPTPTPPAASSAKSADGATCSGKAP